MICLKGFHVAVEGTGPDSGGPVTAGPDRQARPALPHEEHGSPAARPTPLLCGTMGR
jgi:hypothetical protein